MNTIAIFNTRVTKDLLGRGFIIKDIKANPRDEKRTIFLFEDNEEVREYLKNKHDIRI